MGNRYLLHPGRKRRPLSVHNQGFLRQQHCRAQDVCPADCKARYGHLRLAKRKEKATAERQLHSDQRFQYASAAYLQNPMAPSAQENQHLVLLLQVLFSIQANAGQTELRARQHTQHIKRSSDAASEVGGTLLQSQFRHIQPASVLGKSYKSRSNGHPLTIMLSPETMNSALWILWRHSIPSEYRPDRNRTR